jgi:2-iminoacetate synthase
VDERYRVNDEAFTRIIAILRLAVPYTGMILTARESKAIRREVLKYGCSQIDAGTKIELGAYAETFQKKQDLNKEQFLINDERSLGEVIDELLEGDYLPSFCTACYRKGRTGEHFMEFSVPGFIKRFCTPNAILTLSEYIEDYATNGTAEKGWAVIERNLAKLNDKKLERSIRKRIERIKQGERDLYY